MVLHISVSAVHGNAIRKRWLLRKGVDTEPSRWFRYFASKGNRQFPCFFRLCPQKS